MKILVTGGGGFLCQALCRGLVERGHEGISFNRGHYPVLRELGVGQVQGDLADGHAEMHAAAGMDAVFHNAAKAGAWGSYKSYHDANVVGTQNVLDACRAHGIGRLVYTSTPSLTHRATHPVVGGSAADVPYGEGFKAPYATTKLIAEKAVLAANDATLATVALQRVQRAARRQPGTATAPGPNVIPAAWVAPTSGQITRAYGARTTGGPAAQGATVRTNSAAQVVSPAEGEVAYAGSFRSYGNVLILNLDGGYALVLTGLDTINVRVGETVRAGQTVGQMTAAASSAPELYVEVRRG